MILKVTGSLIDYESVTLRKNLKKAARDLASIYSD